MNWSQENSDGIGARHRSRLSFRSFLLLLLQPLIAVASLAGIVYGLGIAQKNGYLTVRVATSEKAEQSDTEYFCPMLCVKPTASPGTCPVCGMDLKPRKKSDDLKDFYGLTIKPASRRLSNIQTVTAVRMPLSKQIGALGKISYDETAMATVSAYVDGRIEELYADFTGVDVKEGQPLALMYSPSLYTSQVEWLEANRDTGLDEQTKKNMVESTRQRLVELGVPNSELKRVLEKGKADSRVRMLSPISGTVIKKLVDQGKYVKTGVPLYQVADLTKVWLMLELFPEDASLVRYGQSAMVSIRSDPGVNYEGRVAFIDPAVDPKTQTVSVRIVVPNELKQIKVGDFATASISVPINPSGKDRNKVYDPRLAGKWISPVHPFIVRDKPGKCPECGTDLKKASDFGFADSPEVSQGVIVIPRKCVLVSGDVSVAYVETKPGRFEFRRLTVGPVSGERVMVIDGIKPGENVVSSAVFMVDSAFNMSGKPSLIDPDREPPEDPGKQKETPKLMAAIEQQLQKLDEDDRQLAKNQGTCPVTKMTLGSLGKPIKVGVDGQPIFICCEGCRTKLLKEPKKYLAAVKKSQMPKVKKPSAEDLENIAKEMAKLSADDRKLAEKQAVCPITDMYLGTMGIPLKMEVKGETVFICCEGCRSRVLSDPDTNLAKIEAYKTYLTGAPKEAGASIESGAAKETAEKEQDVPEMQLPDLEASEEEVPEMELPEMEPPKSETSGKASQDSSNHLDSSKKGQGEVSFLKPQRLLLDYFSDVPNYESLLCEVL